jgi:glycosyltransferase involved in cell wall biosynthesis
MNNSGVLRPLSMAKYLPKEGYEIVVLTSHTSTQKLIFDGCILRVYDGLSALFVKYKFYQIFKVFYFAYQELALRCGFYKSVRKNWYENVLQEMDKIMALVKPDVIISTYPPVETLELGMKFANDYGLPLVSDFRDGLIFEPVEETRMRWHAVRKRYRKIEEDICTQSQAVITVSTPITDYIREKYDHQNVFTIPNGFDSEENFTAPVFELDRSKLHIVHTGRFSLSDPGTNIIPFLEMINDLTSNHENVGKHLRIHLAGKLSAREKWHMRDLIKKRVIIVYGDLKRTEALTLQQASDFLLIVTSTIRRSVATGKLFEYLKTGKPIVALTHGTYCEQVIHETQAGWTVHPYDKNAQGELFLRLLIEDGFRHSLTRNEEAIAQYAREKQIRQVSDILKNL